MNHDQLIIPTNIDIMIHTGDATNWRDPYRNESEMHKFLTWFESINIPNKVFVAGNHETSIEYGLIDKTHIENLGINYLFNETIKIIDFNIWGSPHTPTFGDWAFMKSRAKIGRVWDSIPTDTDIVATHGAPRGILDLTYNRTNNVELCGDISLLKRMKAIQPKAVLFGHIHNIKDISNAGTKILATTKTIFSNATCVHDSKRGKITSNGNILEL
jgi:Icc-related predicted phosphoesterase